MEWVPKANGKLIKELIVTGMRKIKQKLEDEKSSQHSDKKRERLNIFICVLRTSTLVLLCSVMMLTLQ